MYFSRFQHIGKVAFLLSLLLSLISCASVEATGSSELIRSAQVHISPIATRTHVNVALSPAIDTVVTQVLTNMHEHAWNPNAMTHNTVTGGLYINWKMSDPTITNVTNPGSDGVSDHNHDPQVDLLYMESLAEYHSLHPQDTTYNDDLQHTTALVLTDFKNYAQPKGWIYFALLKISTLMNSQAFLHTAQTVASNYYTHDYDQTLGFVYDRSHTPGVYNSDHTITCGAALIDAGIRWNNPLWVTAGEKTISHTIAVAMNTQYHMFYYSMTVSKDGHDIIGNYKAKSETQGQIVDALLAAYSLVHNQQYLVVANQVLQALQSSNMWDATYGGYYFAFDLSTGTPITAYKETRSQSLLLLAFHHYDTLIGPQYVSQERQLIDVLTRDFYQSTYHGYFYRTTDNFQVFVTRPKQGVGTEDYFTTEAMGGALDALQTTELNQYYL